MKRVISNSSAIFSVDVQESNLGFVLQWAVLFLIIVFARFGLGLTGIV